MISQEIIQEATNRLIKTYNPLAIYAYGAYAWGTPSDDDDLNLLIVVEASDEKIYKRGERAFDALLSLDIPKHVAVFTKQEFDRLMLDTTSLCYEVGTKGKQLYARST